MTPCRTLLTLLIIGILPHFVSAKTSLTVEVGWNGVYRINRWTPVFITAADPTPRNADLSVRAAHDSIHAMVINQRLAIGPAPTTYVVYIPLGMSNEDLSVTLRDAKSRRELAHELPLDWTQQSTQSMLMVRDLIIISGGTSNRGMETLLSDGNLLAARWVDPRRLPSVARGYDAVSVLVLSEPDLARMSAEQQSAIVDWVRAGGEVVCALGPDAVPGASPLADLLPAVIGENQTLQLSEQAVKAASLPPRFRTLKARQLTPLPDSTAIPLFNGEMLAYQRRVGLGKITITPADLSGFHFADDEAAQRAWKPLFGDRIEFRKKDPSAQNSYYQPYDDIIHLRRSVGTTAVMNRIGDIPGAGAFGFSYVAIALIGLMLVVGPIDWFVLKRLDRQPWTWITTSGWIVLLTVSAVYLGTLVKSGTLHYRTVRLTDQVDSMTVATIDSAGIYSPRTRYYSLSTGDDQWWEPLASGTNYSRGGMKVDLRFRQTHDGNLPEAMEINVWNLRMVTAEQTGLSLPAIDAKLEVVKAGENRRVQGTITNQTPGTLRNIAVRVGAENIARDPNLSIAAGASVQFDAPLTSNIDTKTRVDNGMAHLTTTEEIRYAQMQQHFVWHEAAWDLAAQRTQQIERMLATPDFAVVYAESSEIPPAVKLDQPAEQEQHQQLIRAVVRLGGAAP